MINRRFNSSQAVDKVKFVNSLFIFEKMYYN